MDEFLEKYGLDFDDLNEGEKDWLLQKVNALSEGQLTIDKIREAIRAMRDHTEQELTTRKDAPTNFVTLLTYFIPVIGLIRKWYHDQHEVELRARLRVLISLEILLTSPERQRREIDLALSNIAGGIG